MTLLESLVVVVRVELTWGTNPAIIILPRLADTNRLPYYPRSVHTHFQGLCVVFGLLISIPSARLTEQLAFPPLRLCESAESDLIASVVRGKPCKVTSPLLRSASSTLGTVGQVQFVVLPSYTYIIPQFGGFVKWFLKIL